VPDMLKDTAVCGMLANIVEPVKLLARVDVVKLTLLAEHVPLTGTAVTGTDVNAVTASTTPYVRIVLCFMTSPPRQGQPNKLAHFHSRICKKRELFESGQ